MIQFALIDSSGVVQRVEASDDPPQYRGLQAVALSQRIAALPQQPNEHAVPVVADGFIAWRDTRSLAQIKAGKWEAIKAERSAKDYAPVSAGGLVLDADAKSRENLLGAVLEMQATGRQTRRWTLADNTRQHLTMAQLVAIGSAIADRTEALQNASQDMREQINAAQTAAQVEAVVWPAGV